MGLFTDEDTLLLISLIEGKIKELEDTIEVETTFERDAIFRDKIIEGSQRMISKYRALYKKLETSTINKPVSAVILRHPHFACR